MKSKVYKWCAVPQCGNTTIKTPNKLFVYVPRNITMRNKWFKLARRDPTTVSLHSPIYFCEEHFDLPNDMDNFMEYHVMGSVSQVRMKPGCIPTKFVCQSDRKKQVQYSTAKRPYIRKKQRKRLIEETVNDSEERSITTKHLEHGQTSSGRSGNKKLLGHDYTRKGKHHDHTYCNAEIEKRKMQPQTVLHKNEDNVAHEEHKTDNKLTQVHKRHKSKKKSSEIEVESVNQTTSPFQPNLQSVCRVCLAFDVKMYDMRDFELSEMFQNITGIAITANNHSITEHLCWECAARLKAAVSFRNKALLSDVLLQGLVTTGKEIQKTDITSIKEKYKNIKSNLSIHEVFHIVHIEEDGEEEQSSTSDAELVQNTLTEGLIEFEDTKIGIKEENIETDITENIITDTTTHLEEESATPQNIDTETAQNTIPEESVAFEDKLKIKEEIIETEIENNYEPMVYIPIKVENMEVDASNIKEEGNEDIFFDPLEETGDIRNPTSISGEQGNIPIGNNRISGEALICTNREGRNIVIGPPAKTQYRRYH